MARKCSASSTTVDEVACQCCATALHTVAGERVFLAYRDLDENGDDTPGVRDVKLMKSDDGGTSFAALGTIADERAIVAFTRKAGEGHEVIVLRAGSG